MTDDKQKDDRQVPAEIRAAVVWELMMLGLENDDIAEAIGWPVEQVIADKAAGHRDANLMRITRPLLEGPHGYARTYLFYARETLARVLEDDVAHDVASKVTDCVFAALSGWQRKQWDKLALEREPPFNKDQMKALCMCMDELELSVRLENCLRNGEIRYIYQLVEWTEADLFQITNFGHKSNTEVQKILTGLDLSLGMKLSAATMACMPQRTSTK